MSRRRRLARARCAGAWTTEDPAIRVIPRHRSSSARLGGVHDLDAIAAEGLGAREGGVGAADQLLGGLAGDGLGDAEAGSEPKVAEGRKGVRNALLKTLIACGVAFMDSRLEAPCFSVFREEKGSEKKRGREEKGSGTFRDIVGLVY